jgi:hypothetical protein
MLRAWSGWIAVCGLVVSGAVAAAQDSGPGPIEGGTSQQYEVTVLKIGSITEGTFTFDVTVEEPTGEEPAPTTSVITTGTFSSTLGTETSTGTWYAIDLGSYSLWVANAEGTAGAQLITGYATPETIVGRIVTQSSTSGRGRFLRALFNSSIFFGTAVEAETPEEPTEPMTTAN